MPRLRFVAALCLAVPLTAIACEADPQLDSYWRVWDAFGEHQRPTLESSQQAWLEYRAATCELFATRESVEAMQEARAKCIAFMARERHLELELLMHVAQP